MKKRFDNIKAVVFDVDGVLTDGKIILDHKGREIKAFNVKDGQMIKRIGTKARQSIERLCGCKVYLDLFVKVREDWRNDNSLLKQFGYFVEED